MTRNVLRTFLVGLLTLLLVVEGPRSAIQAAGPGAEVFVAQAREEMPAPSGSLIIPINEQPFYPDLLAVSERLRYAPLSRVVGESPRETLLNFYAVMAQVYDELQVTTNLANEEPGLFWSPAARKHIAKSEELFKLAVQALDASKFPESVRDNIAEEAAIQLKEVLDYALAHSTVPIEIPDQAGLKFLNEQRSKSSEDWTIPYTTIKLTSATKDLDGEPGFLFSGTTVSHVNRMYNHTRNQPVVDQPFATPHFYTSFIYTPGFLVPPKWYLRLPPNLRSMLETPLDGQSLLQIVAALTTFILYGLVLVVLLRRLLHTYRYLGRAVEDDGKDRHSWRDDNASWYRVLLIFAILPLTWLSEVLVDDYVNFTGLPLLVITYLFVICYFIFAGFFFFFLFEALGRTFSGRLVRWRGGGSDLQLRRVSNLVMPVCRVFGGLLFVLMIYRLFVVIGLPSTTILAFSAVPGLAIGLGASKLLGNLFGGLSIQTDRPVRVGEFCRIGESLGFVTKIGLRSLELQTLESRVTIPNAIVDEQTIVNFSRRQPNSDELPTQSLLVRLAVTRKFNSDQVVDLLHFARLAMATIANVQQPLVSLEEEGGEGCTLLCHGLVAVQSWDHYLDVRERILLRLEEVVEQVHLSQRAIGVSYDTSIDQLERLPMLIREVVERDPLLELRSCRLMTIAAFSYDYSFRFHAHHASLSAVKDAIDRLNQNLLARFAAEGIEIPYPTAVEIRKEI